MVPIDPIGVFTFACRFPFTLPIPMLLRTEPSLRRALFDVVLQEDRRRQLLEAMREVALDQLRCEQLSQYSSPRSMCFAAAR